MVCLFVRKALFLIYLLTNFVLLILCLSILSGLMQGLTSVLITKGIIVVLESRLSEALDLNCIPYETTETNFNEEFQLKTFSKQVLLKVIVYTIATPFLCVSTIDVIQSNLGFKNPGNYFVFRL